VLYLSMRLRIFSSLAVTAIVSALIVCILVTRSAHKSSRRVLIHNEAGDQIKLDWVDPTTGQIISQAESNLAGDTLSLDALVNHAILFRDMNSMVSALTVSPDQYEQMISIKKYPQLVLHVANESAAAAPPPRISSRLPRISLIAAVKRPVRVWPWVSCPMLFYPIWKSDSWMALRNSS
jgi:capsular polysaccharide biosynthesis protein